MTVVVVGDGFAAGDQDTYDKAIYDLLTNGMFTHDFYATHKSAFNLLAINLVSVDSGVGIKKYNHHGTLRTENKKTARGIYSRATVKGWVKWVSETRGRLDKILSIWGADHSEVIVLLNNTGFGGTGGGGFATAPIGVQWDTFCRP